MKNNQENSSAFALLAELMLCLEAKTLNFSSDFENRRIIEIINILVNRYGEVVGDESTILEWFSSDDSPLNSLEKNRLSKMILVRNGSLDINKFCSEIIAEMDSRKK